MSDTPAKPIKISARLDAERSRKLDVLMRTTHLGVSEVIKMALDLYYDQSRAGRRPAAEILRATGFVASGEAAPDLSETYKDELTRSLADKHGPASNA
jgi:hypothetical protein